MRPKLQESSAPLIDPVSSYTAEVDLLMGQIPVQTSVGRLVLSSSMTEGCGIVAGITARQEAVSELRDKPELRGALRFSLLNYAQAEAGMVTFMDGKDISSGNYKVFRNAFEALRAIGTDETGTILQPEAGILSDCIQTIGGFNNTPEAGLARGPVYYTGRGLRSKEDVGWQPRFRFRPGMSGRMVALCVADFMAVRYGVIPPELGLLLPAALLFQPLALVPNDSGTSLKDITWNTRTVYRPLREKLEQQDGYLDTLRAVGELDLLVALSDFDEAVNANGHHTVMPTVQSADEYFFHAVNAKNPLLTLQPGEAVVGNSFSLDRQAQPLNFVTGPNSGGKSTLAKTIVQNQILAQCGAPVVAESAKISLADTIAYHVPMAPEQSDQSGRFGFELKRVKKIRDTTTSRSLTVLDDCLDGTTHEERLEVLKNVMFAFRYLGGVTLFSTHAHEMVSEFEANEVGQFLQVEFGDSGPTYRIISGVSHTSHAENVAALHGFTREQVDAAIRERTGEVPKWF